MNNELSIVKSLKGNLVVRFTDVAGTVPVYGGDKIAIRIKGTIDSLQHQLKEFEDLLATCNEMESICYYHWRARNNIQVTDPEKLVDNRAFLVRFRENGVIHATKHGGIVTVCGLDTTHIPRGVVLLSCSLEANKPISFKGYDSEVTCKRCLRRMDPLPF